jgi:glycogen synthase
LIERTDGAPAGYADVLGMTASPRHPAAPSGTPGPDSAVASAVTEVSGRAALRVLMVTPRFLPHLGGTEIHTFELARRLIARGVDVTVLTTEPESGRVGTDSRYSVPVVRVKAWPDRRDWYVAPHLGRVIRGGSWDLVHLQGIHTMVLPIALAATRRIGVPYVITLHSGGDLSGIRGWAPRLGWLALRRWIVGAERIIAVSEFEMNMLGSLLALPDRKLALIPSGADLPNTSTSRSEEPAGGGQDPTAPLIVSVGRLEKYKGHDRIVRALPAVAAEFPGVRLIILGSGPDEQRLRRISAECGVARRVEILTVSAERREELRSLFDRATLVVALSAYESQGLAAMEAIARGCSVLVAESSALRELVSAGSARGVKPGSTDEIASAVVDQLREPHRPRGQLPTWDACSTKTHEVYLSVCNAAGPLAAAQTDP